MKKILSNLLILTLLFAGIGCSDDEGKTTYIGPVDPGDSGIISEGTPLTAPYIDVTKIGTQPNDPDPEEEPAAYQAILESRKKIIENAIADMIFVDGGTFLMGATAEQGSHVHIYEQTVRQVTLSDYYIGKFQVTQELYLTVMGGTNQGAFKEPGNLNYPIDNRLYSEMETFITRLNEITGLQFALPTEVQWEFAARGGKKRTGKKYAGSDDIEAVVWYWDNTQRVVPVEKTPDEEGVIDESDVIARWPYPVGSKAPNELGIYDMSGNVAEACQDWYAPYEPGDQVDPTGPTELDEEEIQKKVCRGGGWITFADPCRISARSAFIITGRFNYIGFRLVHPKTN